MYHCLKFHAMKDETGTQGVKLIFFCSDSHLASQFKKFGGHFQRQTKPQNLFLMLSAF